MKIGVDITFLPRDKRGMGRYTRGVISALLKANQEIYFSSKINLESFLKDEFKASHLNFIHYKNKNSIESIDVLWHPWNRIDLFGAKKNVVNIHDTLPFKIFADQKNKKYLRADKKRLLDAAKAADLIITLSSFSKKEIINDLKTDSGKIKIIPPGVSEIFEKRTYTVEEKNRLLNKYSNGSPFILYVGSSDARKNWINLLKAFSLLEEKYDIRHKLIIAGKKPKNPGFFSANNEKKEILRILNGLILKGKVVLIEEISNTELVDLYNLAALFVFPSLYEGFGLPILEAQACGASLAVSDKASLPEAAGEGALLFDPYDYAQIADKMRAVITDTDLRESLIKKGFDNVKKYSYKKCAQEMLEEFKCLSMSL